MPQEQLPNERHESYFSWREHSWALLTAKVERVKAAFDKADKDGSHG